MITRRAVDLLAVVLAALVGIFAPAAVEATAIVLRNDGLAEASAATFIYDGSAVARVDVHRHAATGTAPAMLSGAREVSASLPIGARRTSTTSPRSFVATNTARLADDAAGLLGNADDVGVLGRQADTAIAKGWDGHVVLDTPNWSMELNDASIQGAIDQGRTIYLASPTTGNLVQTAGQFAGQPTIYARELNMLRRAGYVRVGDYMVPG